MKYLTGCILCIAAIGAYVPFASAGEWDNDDFGDVFVMPPFEVNGNDPGTFDWDGYFSDLAGEANFWSNESDSTAGQTGGGGAPPPPTPAQHDKQSKDGSCAACSMKYVLDWLKPSANKSEADIMSTMAQDGKFDVSKFDKDGVSRKELLDGIKNLSATEGITTKVDSNTSKVQTDNSMSWETQAKIHEQNEQRHKEFTDALSKSDAAIARIASPTLDNVYAGHDVALRPNADGSVTMADPANGNETLFPTIEATYEFVTGHQWDPQGSPNYMVTFKN